MRPEPSKSAVISSAGLKRRFQRYPNVATNLLALFRNVTVRVEGGGEGLSGAGALVVGSLASPATTFAHDLVVPDQMQSLVNLHSTIADHSATTTYIAPTGIDPTAIDTTTIFPTSSAIYAPTPTAVPTLTAMTGTTSAADHQYGMNMFIWGHPDTTTRDLGVVHQAGFTWQKSLLAWREVEGKCKGCLDWTEADRIVKETQAAGVKLLVRIDFEPDWARADHAHSHVPNTASRVRRNRATSLSHSASTVPLPSGSHASMSVS